MASVARGVSSGRNPRGLLPTETPLTLLDADGRAVPCGDLDMPGDDVLYAAVQRAVTSAAAGGGPTLIEALTYRIEAHTNADDATRYRRPDEVEGWLARDPLARLRRHLIGRGLLDEPAVAALEAEAEVEAAALRHRMNTDTGHDPADLFRYVYTEQTPALHRQQQQLSWEIAAAEEAR